MVWTPIPVSMREAALEGPVFRSIARLADGATVAEAGASLDDIATRLAEENPALAGMGARVVP